MGNLHIASRRGFLHRTLLGTLLWPWPHKALAGKLSVAETDQDWLQQALALRPADQTTAEAIVLDYTQQRAAQALASLSHPQSAAEADATRPALRRKLESSLGYHQFPWSPDLRTRAVGTVQFQGYRIEKLVYQTYPGSQVPAHFYVPDSLDRPAPGVIFYTGHWWPDSKSKRDFQSFCINMTRSGFVVLNWDPFGQGERGSTRDHRRDEGLLVGIAQQGFAEYETQCALEYLLSRPEVKSNELG